MQSRLMLLSVSAILLILLPACGGGTPNLSMPATVAPLPGALTSISIPAGSAPVIDGSGVDLVWQAAPARVFDVMTDGIKPFQITLKSVHDSDQVYFLIQYPDSNLNVDRSSWAYQPDKKAWERLSDDIGDEDEFGFYWNVNVPTFPTKGCKDNCHEDQNKMYTPRGTWLDAWQFNTGRSNPLGWARDFRLTDNPNADQVDNKGGFVMDQGFDTNPGYADNAQKLNGVAVPAYWKPPSGAGGLSVAGDPLYLTESEIEAGLARKIVKVQADGALVDDAGNQVLLYMHIPGRILSQPAGPSWNDIKARGVWWNGVWTAEFARKLNTGHADDVQFDTSKEYYFGMYVKTRQAGEKSRGTTDPTRFVFQ